MADEYANFVHLHVHTQYSLLDGAIRFGDLLAKVKSLHMPAVAMTDHGNMFGSIEFYLKCKDKGVQPIIGCEVYIAPGARTHKQAPPPDQASSYHLIILCENLTGYRNLSYLVSAGYKEGFYRRPRIDKDLLAQHSEGLIVLSACLQGEVPYLAGRGKMEEAKAAAQWYADLFPGSYYLEIQENGIPEQKIANQRVMEIARELNLPLVATNDCHYLNKEDARAHEILLCIQTGKTMSDPSHMRFSTEEFYLKTPEEMAAAFHYAPEALANTVEIAKRCHIDFDFKTYYFPAYDPPPGETLDQQLEREATEGLVQRLNKIRIKNPDFTVQDEQAYYHRLRIELDCIRQMGFPGYFLIVADFINWAKDHGIPVGPGRGSAAGSLVAFCIRITDIDPMPYNLLFERFLNPERISMPDIDVDFCQDRREEVIQYMVDRYGREKVCQIITFGTMAARGVIRDVGRALDLTFADVDKIAKLVPEVLGITLEKAIAQEPKINELAASDPKVKEVLSVALRLEGLARHASTHAAGLVVAPKQMENFCPVYMDQKTGALTTQYSMKYVEKIGLVKFDFLGLKNLTVIENAVKHIRKVNPDFDLSLLGDDDPESYKLLQAGNTTGVFQLESSGMKELLVKLKPSCFEDIIAVCALYRPGPLGSGMVDDFIERKHGRKQVVYDLPQLEPILKDTYGVIVYQEQVMQISRSLAGYSLGGADLLRRAMGKKDMEQMAKERDKFQAGAESQGIDPKKAAAIFDLMAKFAEYGFNKSHSAAYALVAYHTAYLKAHYPVEFMAALLTEDMSSTDKVIKSVSDCREMGIEVLPPDINESDRSFRVLGNSMRFGLGAVKNVGEGAIEAIIEARGEEPFADLFDFCERVDLRRCNKRVIEALIKCGAFDSTGAKRSQLMAVLEDAAATGQRVQQERESAQASLFGIQEVIRGAGGSGADRYPDIPEWDEKYRLGCEKEAIGFFITGHPLARYEGDMKRLTNATIGTLTELKEKSEVKVCGIVTSLKEIMTKKGDRMGFISLEDRSGSVEVVIFSDVYARCSEYVKGDDPIMVYGTLELGEKGAKVMATDIQLLRDVVERETKRVNFTVDAKGADAGKLSTLKDIISRYAGNCRSFLHLDIENNSRVTIRLSESYKVCASEDLTVEVSNLFGYNAVSFE